MFMYGLGLIPNEEESTLFLFELEDGSILEREIEIQDARQGNVDYVLSYEERHMNLYRSSNEDYYWYTYLDEAKAVHFKYNLCRDMDDMPFISFSKNMFEEIKDYPVEKFIIDLRHNVGGDSSIILPFLFHLKLFKEDNPETEIFVIIGRNTFSSGIRATLDLQRDFSVTLVGEATGGSPNAYTELQSSKMPNSGIQFFYSVKYFEGTKEGVQTILPDEAISISIEDFKMNRDVVLQHILNRE